VPGVVLPASVVIPAGTLSQKFCYSLDSSYDWRNVLDVRAQLGSDLALATPHARTHSVSLRRCRPRTSRRSILDKVVLR
jgi:hypothetical protein